MVFFLFLFQNTLTSVTTSGVFTTNTPQNSSSVIEVSSTAFTGITANTVLSAARLQDGLTRDIFPVHNINEDPTISKIDTSTLGNSYAEDKFIMILKKSFLEINLQGYM